MTFGVAECVESVVEEPDPKLLKKYAVGVHDTISNPAHYTAGRAIEPLDVIEDWGLTFHEACILKYLSRAGRKPGSSKLEDLRKARFYLERLIFNEEKLCR